MLNMRLVVVLTHLLDGADLLPELGRHLDFMVDLERRGLLFLSGPLSPTPQPTGMGLSILNVDSIEAAQAIWAQEPFQRQGLRSAEFLLWTVMEGSLNMTLELSSQGVQLRRAS